MVQFRVEFASTSWPSQSHREAILSHRDYIVLLSCCHRHRRLCFATRRQYEGHTMLPDCVRKATRHPVAFATPSYKHRIWKIKNTMASGWKRDIDLYCSNISRGNVDIQKIKNQHPHRQCHNIFIRSLKWNIVKSWYISKKNNFEKEGCSTASIHAAGV